MAFVSFGILSVHPSSGLALGGTRVRLRGYNFAPTPNLTCRFEPIEQAGSDGSLGEAVLVPATYHNSTLVSCEAPPSKLALSFTRRY